MRRTLSSLLSLALLAGLSVALAPSAAGGACTGGQVEVRGRVTDAATTLPLTEVTSVEVSTAAGAPVDGFATDPATSRYSICLDPGSYKIKFVADSYRPEWYDDQPNVDLATVVNVPVKGPVVVNESLVPRGRVIAGRVTNMRGVPKFASISIWRLTSAGWRAYDNIGNDMPSGRWSFRVPGPGRYRVNAAVDYHWARWATSETRLRFARTVVVGVPTTYIDDVHIRVPYCHATPDFCIPPGFLT